MTNDEELAMFREAACLLNEMRKWEEMPAEEKEPIIKKALESFQSAEDAEPS